MILLSCILGQKTEAGILSDTWYLYEVLYRLADLELWNGTSEACEGGAAAWIQCRRCPPGKHLKCAGALSFLYLSLSLCLSI